jgi:hypothetical protein
VARAGGVRYNRCMPPAASDLDDLTLGLPARPRVKPSVDPAARARRVLLISAAVTLALYVVPFGQLIARPLVYLSTLVHELGHGMTAMAVGGHFDKLLLYGDGSGLAHSFATSRWEAALIAAGGLIGPAVAAAIGFAVARRASWSRAALAVLGVFLVWVMIFKMRTAFGMVVAGAVAASSLAVAWRARADRAQLVLGFLSVQLALSVFSRGDYLFTDTAATGGGTFPSDTAGLAATLGGPYWLWGAICAGVSVAALLAGAWLMLRGVRRQRSRAA